MSKAYCYYITRENPEFNSKKPYDKRAFSLTSDSILNTVSQTPTFQINQTTQQSGQTPATISYNAVIYRDFYYSICCPPHLHPISTFPNLKISLDRSNDFGPFNSPIISLVQYGSQYSETFKINFIHSRRALPPILISLPYRNQVNLSDDPDKGMKLHELFSKAFSDIQWKTYLHYFTDKLHVKSSQIILRFVSSTTQEVHMIPPNSSVMQSLEALFSDDGYTFLSNGYFEYDYIISDDIFFKELDTINSNTNSTLNSNTNINPNPNINPNILNSASSTTSNSDMNSINSINSITSLHSIGLNSLIDLNNNNDSSLNNNELNNVNNLNNLNTSNTSNSIINNVDKTFSYPIGYSFSPYINLSSFGYSSDRQDLLRNIRDLLDIIDINSIHSLLVNLISQYFKLYLEKSDSFIVQYASLIPILFKIQIGSFVSSISDEFCFQQSYSTISSNFIKNSFSVEYVQKISNFMNSSSKNPLYESNYNNKEIDNFFEVIYLIEHPSFPQRLCTQSKLV